MACKSCGSNRVELLSEIGLHFPELKYLHLPPIFVFPKLFVCLECGLTEFTMPDKELRLIAKVVRGEAKQSDT